MRKLKLQMQLSVDGYVAGPNGEMDWMTWNWGDDIKAYVKNLTAPVATIIMGRRLAEGFIPHWEAHVTNPETRDEFSTKMVETPKMVFTKTMHETIWDNTAIANGDLAAEVKALKRKEGGEIITYGGSSFAGALIKNNLIDEYHLFFNPAVIGTGMPIFNRLAGRLALQLVKAEQFDCGIAALCYKPAGR